MKIRHTIADTTSQAGGQTNGRSLHVTLIVFCKERLITRNLDCAFSLVTVLSYLLATVPRKGHLRFKTSVSIISVFFQYIFFFHIVTVNL